MNTMKPLCAILLLASSVPALACEIPSLIQIPLDESATTNRKTLIQIDMIGYLSGISSYVDCLREDYEAARAEDAPSSHLTLIAARNNAARAEIEAMQKLYTSSIGPIEELAEIESEACIDAESGLRDIVVNDQTIVFYTRRDDIYVNVLAAGCPILRSNNSSLDYVRARGARFDDSICVGSPLTDATTPASAELCVLGPFYPITDNEAEELRNR